LTAEFHYFAARALQEALRAIDAKPGAPQRAHEQLSRAYAQRVIAALEQRDG
jgi:hypothetical protein